MSWWRRHGAVVAVLVVAGVAWVAMSATTVLWHDHGEYVVVATRGGVPHPPGYPLYVLWLRAWSWLPAPTPVAATSYATVLLGLTTLVLLYRATVGFWVSRSAAAAATAVFGLSSRATLTFTHAENLALNALLAAGVLWVAAPRTVMAPGRKSLGLAALIGLGLANHHTIVLMAPVVSWAVVVDLRRVERRIPVVGGMVLLGLVGLSPYLTLMLHHGPGAWVWGDFSRWSDVADHFFRTEYGLALAPQRDGGSHPLAAQWSFLAATLARDTLWGFGLVGLGAMGAALVALRRSSTRRAGAGAIALVATFVTSGPLFVAMLNVSPKGITGYEVARFHLLPSMILAVFVGRGLFQLWRRLRNLRLRPLLHGLPCVVAGIGLLFTAPDVAALHRPTVEHYLRNTLVTLPDDAVVVTSGDHRLFGYLYLQRGLGLREDVTIISPTMLFRPWYRRGVEEDLGLALPMVGERTLDMVRLADAILGSGRPLFLGNVGMNYEPILAAFPNRPFGALVKVEGVGASSPTAAETEVETLDLFSRYTLEERPPNDPYGIGRRVFATYARPWHYLAATYSEQEQPARASAAEQRASAFLTP